MKDRRVAALNDEIEAGFLEEVLKDRQISYRIERCEDNYWGLYLGRGFVSGVHNSGGMLLPYAYVWGYVDDAKAILLALEQVRGSEVLSGDALPAPRMFRIKKS